MGLGDDDIRLIEPGERIAVAGALGASYTPHCARVQPAKLVRGLADAVRALGVPIYEQTPVTELRTAPPRAVTPHGTVTADHVIRCTEGFTATFARTHRDWLPMNSSLIVTEPFPTEAWPGAELLGDWRTTTCTPNAPPTAGSRSGAAGAPIGTAPNRQRRQHAGGTIDALRSMLVSMFPAAADVPVAHAWSGVLGVPRDWCATVVLGQEGLGYAGGYTGHGVATSNLAGRTLRDLVLRRDTDLTTLPWVDWRVAGGRWSRCAGSASTSCTGSTAGRTPARPGWSAPRALPGWPDLATGRGPPTSGVSSVRVLQQPGDVVGRGSGSRGSSPGRPRSPSRAASRPAPWSRPPRP